MRKELETPARFLRKQRRVSSIITSDEGLPGRLREVLNRWYHFRFGCDGAETQRSQRKISLQRSRREQRRGAGGCVNMRRLCRRELLGWGRLGRRRCFGY